MRATGKEGEKGGGGMSEREGAGCVGERRGAGVRKGGREGERARDRQTGRLAD